MYIPRVNRLVFLETLKSSIMQNAFVDERVDNI